MLMKDLLPKGDPRATYSPSRFYDGNDSSSPGKCDSPKKTSPREADMGSDGPKRQRYKAFLTVYNVDHETETDYGSDEELAAKRRAKA